MAPNVDGVCDGESSSRPTCAVRAVTIQEGPEEIPAAVSQDELNEGSPGAVGPRSPKLHRASIAGKKLSGRPPIKSTSSSQSLTRQFSNLRLEQEQPDGENITQDPSSLLSQVVHWLQEEKAKRVSRRFQSYRPTGSVDPTSTDPRRARKDSQDSEVALALDRLERILSGFAATAKGHHGHIHQSSTHGLKSWSISKKLRRSSTVGQSSDTDYQDGEHLVPNVEATLDNSKTMAYTGGCADDDDNSLTAAKTRDKEDWVNFKREIVRLTHTLKIKGWRRVPIEKGDDIAVVRLSGALTNAVYVVSPPRASPEQIPDKDSTTSLTWLKRPPMKLLLRIYGPQVEHLIDRESELAILRRLAKKRIGPRMLGTFSNGRFEEFFHARTLTPEDLRVPHTSKQIAKRMRELHDGIDLLEEERTGGPFVLVNWDKWVGRCEQVITWLDKQILSHRVAGTRESEAWMRRGLVCGVEWPLFRNAVEKYRKYVEDHYGGTSRLEEHLVFAHNDTQYGNLMRLQPSGESPLLLAENEHKQLVVIDFEYASANTPGFEFANHFTEWCYNYHHPEKSWACSTSAYPTPKEQHRFVRSYVMHRPQFSPSTSSTPKLAGRENKSISAFMLDSRAPGKPAIDYDAEERAWEEATEEHTQRLIHETKIWRGVCSAQWVAWGILQAKIPELDEKHRKEASDGPSKSRTESVITKMKGRVHPQSDPLDAEVKALQEDAKHDRPESRLQEEAHQEGADEGHDEGDKFDYLAYAQDRAMFFWGDCLQLGLVRQEELPESLRGKVKVVEY